MSAPAGTVLFVDDEERILRSLRMLFRSRFDVLIADSAARALQIVGSRPVHALVSDQRMPEMTGVELLRRVREVSPATMRLLLTGYSDLHSIVASVNEGEIFRFIEKPWQPQYLLDVVGQAVQVAIPELAASGTAPGPAPRTSAAPPGLKLLVVDETRVISRLVRELVGERDEVFFATSVDTALAILSEQRIAVVVAQLMHRQDDIAGVLKTLKRYNPRTLAIVTSSLRDSRTLIELINQGQIFRFLPAPLSRELLRRSLQSACEHYTRLGAAPGLLRRHAVERASTEPASLSSRLLDYWRRIRDNGQPVREER